MLATGAEADIVEEAVIAEAEAEADFVGTRRLLMAPSTN